MSRIAKQPITVPKGVVCQLAQQSFSVKGKQGELKHTIHNLVNVTQDENIIKVTVNEDSQQAWAIAGTTRALLNNLIKGVDHGFEKKLLLVGVGFRAEMKGHKLVLNVGFSHIVEMTIPASIHINTPSQTEIIITGSDKQLVGQIAANIRNVRPPEPYKGKGIRYSDEKIELKETKK